MNHKHVAQFLFLLVLTSCAGSAIKSPDANKSDAVSDAISPKGSIATSEYKNAPQFRWPTRYPYILAYFGWRKKRMHEGIDLRAPRGTRLYSAAAGEVIEAGARIRGYGKTVIIDHGDGWSTLYAHCSEIKTKRGVQVKKGQLVALSGRTGRASGPHLHFEVRKGSDPLDPLMFLPPVDGDPVDSEMRD